MSKQLHSYRPEWLQSLIAAPIVNESLIPLAGRCSSDVISDGKIAIQHVIPYTRSCWDFYSVETGLHLRRIHGRTALHRVLGVYKELQDSLGNQCLRSA